ncbi:uncharacterized protein N7477_008404 [Penicillium maclennaniae]|uniref:uncharacterized protein n=1 Tax=Penicillium maclennaniae TaxID=1343394 RepID=UPI0025400B3C|nr:uncharacterized protein N7477_008404 [Penicillium maclennaniae]KAJ5665956.1 hypothetical protein N7477_008404 [Penicillium maclennaniae]
MAANHNKYPISSNSRTKLNAFRFQDVDEISSNGTWKDGSKPAHRNKENQSSWLNGVIEPMHNPSEKSDPQPQGVSAASAKELKPVKECPQTPANRIPLADLISNAEDSFDPAPGPEITPVEHVIWEHIPASSNPDASSQTPANRRKKRRHRSSSPGTPSHSASKKQKEPFDLQSIQALFKTPQHDLAAELWNNYVDKNMVEGSEDLPPPRLANLLSSSPQTPASRTSRDSSGLRRSISCAAEWPTSRGREGESTNKTQALAAGLGDTEAVKETLLGLSGINAGNGAGAAILDLSSEFSDDGLDQDLMNLADVSEDPFVETASSRNGFESLGSSAWSNLAAEKQQPSHPEHADAVGNQRPIMPNIMNNDPKHDELDDFEDDYGDFADDFQDILAKCDEKQQNAAPTGSIPAEQQAIKRSNVSILPTVAEDEFSTDEFDDDFDVDAIEQTLKQISQEEAHNLKDGKAIKRYQIIDTAEKLYVTPKGRTQPEQVLCVEDEKTRTRKVIILRESWFDTPCSKDSYIHLVGDFDLSGQCVVDNTKHMIILHPDHLISATVVADSIDCQRRAVLQDRVKAFGQLEKPQAFGVFFHEVFQEALQANKWDLGSLKSVVVSVMEKHIEELYSINMSVAEAVAEIMGKIPTVQAWANVFLQATPQANSLVEDRNSSKLNLSINKLLEVEEHIWSPMYGLKGNIDATVQVTSRGQDGDQNLLVPLELKTGKRDTNQAHRAQTALYTLLLSDRYDVDVNFGLLYYLENSRTLSIRGIRHELLQMIQVRNQLAGYIRERLLLPPMLKKARMCNRCYAKTPCLIYHKLAEDGDGETSALGEDFELATSHLNHGDRDFFRKWDELLTKEEGNLVKFRRELWTLLSSEREPLGRCFGDVVIDPRSACEEPNGTKINRYRYTFFKRRPRPSFSFAESQISVGEPIVVSDQKGHFALANGYVIQLSASHITVAVDRKLHNARARTVGFDAVKNQSFRGIMEIGSGDPSDLENPDEEMVYRIDKDEFSNGMAIVRNNLICLMDKDLFQARNLRRLIVEGQPPVFKTSSSANKLPDPGSLNVDQKEAITKVMSAKDYALVLGMPGKSVLLTSYTHTAVDNILLKIRDDNIRVLRIGAATKIHPEVQQFADLAAIPKKTIEELKDSWEKPQVVATTCLGVNHSIFNQRIFDYCIVDEASQITLPVCLGPIRMARTFILVGDHYQLPPLVQNKAAQEGGLDVSLFKLLSDAQPDSVVNLEHQYRMCEEIMLLSNTLIYSGRLKCGTPEVAARSLDVPNINALKQFHADGFHSSQHPHDICPGPSQGHCWLKDLIEPSAKTLLVNTDTLGAAALENAQGQRVVNHMETILCSQLVEAFIASGIPARNIGVITFYRSQLALLRQKLRKYTPDLEMHTTDKFQGRDKEVVILSCVRSNSENHVGDLLRDWRRVNVAFTRARTKLLVVGSRSTLRDGNDLLYKYVRLVEGKGGYTTCRITRPRATFLIPRLSRHNCHTCLL